MVLAAGISDQLYATLEKLFDPVVALIMSALVVVLLMTYLVTAADSAIVIGNASNAERRHHMLFWGAAIALVVGSMLMFVGNEAIRITMIIGALPVSFVMGLMA
ncbi:MAG: BCCT family transporter, partial [Pontixanthobacter sp.]